MARNEVDKMKGWELPTLFFTLVILLSFLINWLWLSLIPVIEGKFFPVTGRLVIENTYLVSSLEGNRTRVVGHVEKYRDCDRISLQWFIGKRSGQSAEVFAEFRTPPTKKKTGYLHFDHILVGIDPLDLNRLSFANITHDCHSGWLWNTVTEFYDSTELETVK